MVVNRGAVEPHEEKRSPRNQNTASHKENEEQPESIQPKKDLNQEQYKKSNNKSKGKKKQSQK